MGQSLETGAVRTAQTDSSGTYQILSIPAGDYDVEADAVGFQTAIRNLVTVTLGATEAVAQMSQGALSDGACILGLRDGIRAVRSPAGRG